MKHRFLPFLGGFAVALAALSSSFAEPTVHAPVQAYGGGRTVVLNDLELTAITRAEESYLPQVNAVTKARAELDAIAFQLPMNQAELTRRVNALGAAELALALSRADAFGRLRTELTITSPDKLQLVAQSVSGDTSTGGRGGGGRGAAPTFPQLFGGGRGN